jgi:hypothetical protein
MALPAEKLIVLWKQVVLKAVDERIHLKLRGESPSQPASTKVSPKI